MAGSTGQISHAIERLESHDVTVWLHRMASGSKNWRTMQSIERLRAIGLESERPHSLPHFPAYSFMLASLLPADRLAIEMWLSEEDEARALTGELAMLKRQWQEAEELAAIADRLARGEDTPL